MKVLKELALELLDDLNIDPAYYFDISMAVSRASVRNGCGKDILWLSDPLERAGAFVQEVLRHATGESMYAFEKSGDIHGYRAFFDGSPGLVGANLWRDAGGGVNYRVIRDVCWHSGEKSYSPRTLNRSLQSLLFAVEDWSEKSYVLADVVRDLSSFPLKRVSKEHWEGVINMSRSRGVKRPRRPVNVDLYAKRDSEGYTRAFVKMYNK